MAADSERDASKYWRDKYLDLLNEHETLEQRTRVEYEQLRRGIVVTSLLAEGQSTALDPLLRSIRSHLKEDGAKLASTVNALSKQIDTAEEQNAQRVEILLGLITDAAEKLSKCPLPKPLIKRVKKVRQQAVRDLETWDGYAEQLQNWVQVIGELAALENPNKEPVSAWWKQWFKPTDNPTAPDSNTDTDTDVAAATNHTAPTDSAEDTPEPSFAYIANDVIATLNELFEQLVIPERLAYLQQSLQERLQQQLHWYELVPLLEDTSSFLLQCLESSQVKIEQFLQNLDQRLQAIRAIVTEASSNREDRAKARESLDQMVREQLSDIHSVVTGSSDLKQLSTNVGDHLALILQAMEFYRDSEEQREQALLAQLDQLQQRLAEIEQEIKDNRQALEQQRIKATTDSLTGLPNREAYNQRLIDEHARFHRYNTPLALVIGDVDHFKRINDTYGHLAGDKVLQLIARTMQKNIRDVDFVARFGGEEFVILMPETSPDQAFLAAEKLRKVIERSPFNFRKERVNITMSFGIAEFKVNEMPDIVFERADKALYQSKAKGRNTSSLG